MEGLVGACDFAGKGIFEDGKSGDGCEKGVRSGYALRLLTPVVK